MALWFALMLGFFATVPAGYEAEIKDWQAKRSAGLKADGGWLSVAGLFWLHEGDNSVGHDPDATVVLPEGEKSIGRIHLAAGKIAFTPSVSGITLNGRPVAGEMALKSDENEETPDHLVYHDVTMFVIKRGARYAIRMLDKNSPLRREFTGLHYFPIRPELRFEARFVTYPTPKMITIQNVLNEEEQQKAIGYAVFHYEGKEYTLEPVIEDKQLFYIFKDLTAGKETYPAGRFFYSEFPKDGKVILDFNKAYNPPCAFTPYATCPLPPKQNRLPIRIEAGELKYGQH